MHNCTQCTDIHVRRLSISPVSSATVSACTRLSAGSVTLAPRSPHPPCCTEYGLEPNTGSLQQQIFLVRVKIFTSSVKNISTDLGVTTTEAGWVLVSASQTLATVTLPGTHWSEVTMEAGSSTLMEDTHTELSRSNREEVALNRDCKWEVYRYVH